MNIPKSLKIKHHKWKIIFTDKKSKLNTKKYNGMCVHADKEILIDPKLSRNDKEETFWHELLHAIFPDDVCSNKKEERIVFALGEQLWPIMQTLYKMNIQRGGKKRQKNRHHRRIQKKE